MRRPLLFGTALLALGGWAVLRPVSAPRLPANPPPTENWLDPDAEADQKAARKAWFRERHRAPPDVDVEAIERENGLRQIAKRNAIARGQLPPPDQGAWVERGSVNQAGRMHVAARSSDQEVLYAGSALGGVWRSDPDGGSWTPIGDNLYGGAHWLVVLPPETEGGPDVVLAGTDWGSVHRTADDGETWEAPEGLPTSGSLRRLLKTSDGSEAVFAVYDDWTRTRLYRSTDGGVSFDALLDLGGFSGDLWAPRDGGSALYLLSSDGIAVSEDLGESWEIVGPLPASISRGELTGSEAGAPRLWVVAENTVYRSDDAGVSWVRITTASDYWGSLAASIHDIDVFAWGGVEVYRTEDGGESFAIVNRWWDYYDRPETRLHADIPGIDVLLDASGEELWYVSTDGGLYRSTDRLETVENLSLDGLRVSQYYGTLTSAADPTHVAAGAQDQGWQVTNTVAGEQGEILAFEQLISGDYGHLTSSDGTHAWLYSVYPGWILVHSGEDEPQLLWAEPPPSETSYAWLPLVVADPEEPTSFFFGGSRLWRYTFDGWATWTPEAWSDQSFADSSGEYLSALAFSPVDPARAYGATNRGRLFASDDGGVTWTLSGDGGPVGSWYYGAALLASSADRDTAWVGGSGYDGPAVYRTTDGGRTWEAFDEGLPETLVYSLGEAPDGSGVLVAGTETAAYRRDPESSEWVDITGVDAPVTIYWSVEALRHENTMRFGTYGRGIWDYQLDPEGTGCFPVQDRDGDGHGCDVDCDDADPDVHPGADDACDGKDRDCDGDAEGDADGDGVLDCEDCDPDDPKRAEKCARACGCVSGTAGLGLWVIGLVAVGVRRRRG